jgi:hypothetical protein
VIGRHDRDSIDLAILEQTPEVAEHLWFVAAELFDRGDRALRMAPVDVADGAYADILVFEEAAKPSHPHPANANHAQHDLVARLWTRMGAPAERGNRHARGRGL